MELGTIMELLSGIKLENAKQNRRRGSFSRRKPEGAKAVALHD
jgi:hypothetical protein